ncbi:predicted protein [Sclerotinia sclerotiorum 1980 UF-70]|uniref:Uncharacterized protein n=1 Tax=Sclerotinia sclerotiorum (strain ATCC 18683 / 1980 / Ss-1) TaxID=665079 RepID=A7E4V3_SCLS1|nr:predicted protein [Sclerotinia sclerotiorum 1980 UF-70]EDN90925.1 predicted protein [Sclerotinia sclerotiorum 1980 UF-70]
MIGDRLSTRLVRYEKPSDGVMGTKSLFDIASKVTSAEFNNGV